jgi:hypothetical protein
VWPEDAAVNADQAGTACCRLNRSRRYGNLSEVGFSQHVLLQRQILTPELTKPDQSYLVCVRCKKYFIYYTIRLRLKFASLR